MLFVFAFVPWISEKFDNKVFGVDGGYSIIWLIVLYIIGAAIRIYGPDIIMLKQKSSKKYFVWAVFCGLIIGMSKIFIAYITINIFGHDFLSNILISYISPICVLESIYIFAFFTTFTMTTSKINNNLILKISRITFDVYIIHLTSLFKKYLWPSIAIYISQNNFLIVLSYIIVPCIVLFLCYVVKNITDCIIKILNIENVNNYVCLKVKLILNRLVIKDMEVK